MDRLKVVAVTALTLWVLGACGSCGASSNAAAKGPTQADLAGASVGGTWTLSVTFGPYTGPPPGPANHFPTGHTATDRVTFVRQCPSAGACTLQMWGPEGPDATKAAYYAYYGSATGLEGPPVRTPMTESGATYSQAIAISGFGGFSCPPSQTVAKPVQRLSLTVTAASSGSSGWSATAMSGEETLLSGWGCGPAGFTGWTVAHLKIAGRAGS